MNNEDWAYLAGLLDGEGYIGIKKYFHHHPSSMQ